MYTRYFTNGDIMYDRTISTLSLINASWDVLRKNKSMMIFPLLSSISIILIIFSFSGAVTLSEAGTHSAVFYVKLWLFYFINYFIITFFNVGLTSCALERLNNESSTVQDGILLACKKIHLILIWALFCASIGTLLQFIEDKLSWVGRIISNIFGTLFALASYLMIPIMVAEDKTPWTALKDSAKLFKKTWGKQIKGEIGIGLYYILLSLPGVFLVILGIKFSDSPHTMQLFITLGVLYMMLLWLGQATLNTVFRGALYVYSKTGEAPKGFEMIESMSLKSREKSKKLDRNELY